MGLINHSLDPCYTIRQSRLVPPPPPPHRPQPPTINQPTDWHTHDTVRRSMQTVTASSVFVSATVYSTIVSVVSIHNTSVYQTPLSASSNVSGIHLKYLQKLDPIMAHWPESRQNYTYMAWSRANGSDIYVRASSAAMDHSQGVAVRWGHHGDPDRKRGSAGQAMVHTTSLAFDLGPRRDLAH